MKSKHRFASAVADGGNAALVHPSNWNDDHVLIVPVAAKTAGYTIVAGDQRSILRAAHSATLTFTLLSACDADWAVWIENRQTGTGAASALAIARADTIDDVATIYTYPGDLRIIRKSRRRDGAVARWHGRR